MNIIEDSRRYMHPDGTISLHPPLHKSDNNFLFTATYHFILHKIGVGDPEAREKFFQYIISREVEKGLYTPEASWSDPTISHDEINGIVAFDAQFARDVFEYGVDTNWSFMNLGWQHFWAKKTWKERFKYLGGQWMFRMGYLVPFIRIRAGRKVPLIEQIGYCLALIGKSLNPPGETSGRCLIIIQSQFIKDMPTLMRLAQKSFLLTCQKDYFDLSALYQIYFGPDHFFTRHTKGVKFL